MISRFFYLYKNFAFSLCLSMCLSSSLSGCSSLIFPSVETPQRYVLTKVPKSEGYAFSPRLSKTIAVDKPNLYGPLETRRVAVLLPNYQLDYFANMEWAEQLETLIQDTVIYSFQDDDRFASVSRGKESLNAQTLVKIDVRKFYIDQTQQPFMATAEYFITLLERQEGGKVSSRSKLFSSQIPLPQDLSYDELPKKMISTLMNHANQQVVRDILGWL